tara:strand:- start:751 stop:963 length:213 start_codon:yes stop_codon:yes gene_type:complete
MKVIINGDLTIIKSDIRPMTIAVLIKELGHHPQLIVVEFNGDILEPQKWGNQEVKNGDNLEIVTIVGGGS